MYEMTFFGMTTDGKRRIRTTPDLFLQPGDTVIYGPDGNDSFVAGQITYLVDTTQAWMEVMER